MLVAGINSSNDVAGDLATPRAEIVSLLDVSGVVPERVSLHSVAWELKGNGQ
ncbi:hypothetical protein CBM2598_U30176 [Cupriavidus taiwanensis]|nr:hypothetical protein CBM2597_U30161 [Cupriavidus taiwanensis]SOZ97161.1 hypothetical protein CBM2598_U30176 [Cupriavidus taiwanensis]